MIRQTIHNITDLKISKVETAESRGREFHTLSIEAIDNDGNKLELVLFRDDKEALKPNRK